MSPTATKGAGELMPLAEFERKLGKSLVMRRSSDDARGRDSATREMSEEEPVS